MISFTNSLTKQKEVFTPVDTSEKPVVKMYHCGPTVYDEVHIGNLRAFILADLVRRVVEFAGYKTLQVMNVTDIGHLSSDADDGEDKMTKGLKREGMPITLKAMIELATRYTGKFLENLDALNIQRPHHVPRASDHIAEDIELIKKLEAGGFTYATSDGLYFDTAKYPEYGQLGGVVADEDREGRIAGNSEKHSVRDFALWKKNEALGYESPWGKGFPGWHIECSAMSTKYLGEEFDIHTGGIDLKPVHHNNEIAQSVCATGKGFAKYWLHNAFINVDSGKMAKSEGTGFTLSTVIAQGFSPLAYRYWLLGGHYSTPMTFSWDALEQAQNGYEKLKQTVAELEAETSDAAFSAAATEYQTAITKQLTDDINTAEALATLWTALKDAALSGTEKMALVKYADQVLGLKLTEQETIPPNVLDIVNKREEARKNKDWQASDALRGEVETLGYTIKDTERGSRVYKTYSGE